MNNQKKIVQGVLNILFIQLILFNCFPLFQMSFSKLSKSDIENLSDREILFYCGRKVGDDSYKCLLCPEIKKPFKIVLKKWCL